MSLNDLEKKLYDPDSGIENRKHEVSGFDPLVAANNNPEGFKQEKAWVEAGDPIKTEKKNALKWGFLSLGAIILIAVSIVGYVKYVQSAFSEQRVTIRIEGSTSVSGSQNYTYKIFCKNDNRTQLDNVELILNYPENLKLAEKQNLKIENPSNSRIALGNIKGNAEAAAEINGIFLAVKDTVIYLNATLEYTPHGFSIKYQSRNQLGVKVDSSPLAMEIEAPLEVSSGNKVDYVVDYNNSNTENFQGVRLKANYPEGFTFVSSVPSPSEGNNVWYLGNVSPNQNGKVIISGTLQGSADEGKIIQTQLGYIGNTGNFVIYDQKNKSTKITSSILSISQSLDNESSFNVDAGEKLFYLIEYKNNGSIALKDAIVTEEIDSKVLDFSKLDMANRGSYNADTKTITWRVSDVPGLANLAPGEGGIIRFSIPVFNRIPIGSANDNNFSVISTAKIDSPSIPNPIGSNKIIASNTLNLKLNSRVVLDEKGYYKDAVIDNSGPIPLKVGSETTFTMHWKIINVSNAINGTKIVSSLPSGVSWKGKFMPSDESITFNERTNQIEWNVGSLKNGVGIIEPEKEVSFQIGVTPQINQVGDNIVLLNAAVLTAKDAFTGTDIKVEVGAKNNILTEDPSIGINYKVVQ